MPPHLKTPFNDLKGAQVKVGLQILFLVAFLLVHDVLMIFLADLVISDVPPEEQCRLHKVI